MEEMDVVSNLITDHQIIIAEIINNQIIALAQGKSPGYDLITAKVLRNLPKEVIAFLTQLFNAMINKRFELPQWKVAEIKMILKPDKNLWDTKSYRPMSQLAILSKVLERLFLARFMLIVISKHLIPDHQFGFRQYHGTIEQVHNGSTYI